MRYSISVTKRQNAKTPLLLRALGIDHVQDPIYRPNGFPVWQLFYGVSGSGEFRLDGWRGILRPGQAAFLAPNEAHSYRSLGGDWVLHYIGFEGELCQKLLASLGLAQSGLYSLAQPEVLLAHLHTLERIQLEAAHIKPTIIQEFKERADSFIPFDYSSTNMTSPEKIEHVLKTFGVITKVAREIEGYSSNTYLLEVSQGVNLKAISKYNLNIASALDVANVRIPSSLVVHDGKSYLAIEANHKRTKDLLWDGDALEGRRIPIGKDNYGNTVVWDLDNHSTPHLLICGATGSGKSVSILSTIKYAMKAGIDDIYVFDPKYEFTGLQSIGVKVVNDIDEIEDRMAELELNMQLRTNGTVPKRMTLLVFDEFADALMQSSKGKALDIKDDAGHVIGRAKSLEENLRMLLQKGRSLGFRVMAATQRASVKVITGDTKVNFPVRVCFRVPSEVDSKVVLDEPGAEMLAGMGDGLMRSPEYMDKLVRFQGYYCGE